MKSELFFLKRICVFILLFCFTSMSIVLHASAATDPILTYIKKQKGTISYQYINLKTNRKMGYKATNQYRAASTIKLPLVLYVYELASQNKVNLNEKLTYKSYHYNGGSGVIQNHRVGSKYTIRKLAEYAFVHSDNIAFVMLREKVGKQNFINYTKKLGSKGAYPGGQNLTSASDLTLYASRLYTFAEKNELGKELVSYLTRAVYRSTIPKGIPNVKVANKAGLIPMNLVYNDVAIVYEKNEPYVVTIMTNGISYEKAQKVIAELSGIIHSVHLKRVKSTPLKASNIKVVNNKGTADLITISSLLKGDVVRVFNVNSGGKLLTSKQATGPTVTLSYKQLGVKKGNIFVSVVKSGYAESKRVSAAYSGEPSEPLRATDVKIINNKNKADEIYISNVKIGDFIKVYNASKGGKRIAYSGPVKNSSITISPKQLGASAGFVYISVTHTDMAESGRTAIRYGKEE